MPPIPGRLNGGGPAGGGVPGGVEQERLGVGQRLARVQLEEDHLVDLRALVRDVDVPLPVKPAGNVNEKSPSDDRRRDDRRASLDRVGGLATLTSPTMPCAACGLPSCRGMKHTTA